MITIHIINIIVITNSETHGQTSLEVQLQEKRSEIIALKNELEGNACVLKTLTAKLKKYEKPSGKETLDDEQYTNLFLEYMGKKITNPDPSDLNVDLRVSIMELKTVVETYSSNHIEENREQKDSELQLITQQMSEGVPANNIICAIFSPFILKVIDTFVKVNVQRQNKKYKLLKLLHAVVLSHSIGHAMLTSFEVKEYLYMHPNNNEQDNNLVKSITIICDKDFYYKLLQSTVRWAAIVEEKQVKLIRYTAISKPAAETETTSPETTSPETTEKTSLPESSR